MKRCATTLVALVLAVPLALFGCSSQSASTEPVESTDISQLSGTITMADFMHLRYADFDAFDEGIESGESVPVSLRLFVEGETNGYVHDQDEIVRMWRALRAIRFDVDHPLSKDEAAELDDPYTSFSFDSGRSLVSFPFVGNSCAMFSDDEVYPVEDPAKVQTLVDELVPLVLAEMPQPGEVVTEQNGVWHWDANGDGMLEDMDIEFVGNGDEAPCALAVHLFGSAYNDDEIVEDGLIDEVGYVEFGYKPLEVRLKEDDRGPYVVLTYATGYFDMGDCTDENPSGYTVGPEERCTIRLVNGTLQIEPLESTDA